MYDPQQHFVDVQENPSLADQKSWLSAAGDNNPSSTLSQTHSISASASTAANIDPVLFNNIVEMVPLIEHLIHRKAHRSFTRRGSMIYTKTPSRESSYRKASDSKGRNATQSIPGKKKREHGDKDQSKNGSNNQDYDNLSIFSSRSFTSEKDIEELVTLREQLEDLQKKLAEKDELLKSAEISKSQMNAVHGKLDELKHQAAEKDVLIKSTQLQLSDAKIKLADKQAALEKTQWEAMTSNTKVEKLQEELGSVQRDISSMMVLFESLTKTNNESTATTEDYDVKPQHLDYLPDIDDMDDVEMEKMEEARQAYIVAVATAKEKQDEESMAAAASARLHLQSLVFRSNGKTASNNFSNGGLSPAPHRSYVY